MSTRIQDQIQSDIFAFLKSQGVMTLATQSVTGPWVATLYFGIDDHMDLYILTDPNSIHGQHIAQNPQVAFNIFDSHQKITNPKLGVQGRGNITLIKGIAANTRALMLWHRQNPGIEKNITIKDVKKYADTKLYKITPSYLKFFNKVLYAPEEYGIWKG